MEREREQAFELFKRAYGYCAGQEGRRPKAEELCKSVMKDTKSIARFHNLLGRWPHGWADTLNWTTDNLPRAAGAPNNQAQMSPVSAFRQDSVIDLDVRHPDRPSRQSRTSRVSNGPLQTEPSDRPRRITKSNHVPHDIGYFLPDFDTVPIEQDLYAAMRQFLSGSYNSHSLLLEFVIEEAPALLAGRAHFSETRIVIENRNGQGIRAVARRGLDRDGYSIPHLDIPLIVNVVVEDSVLRPYYGRDGAADHANVIYSDPIERSIELFEPHGVAAWTYDVIKAIKRLKVFPEWDWIVPAASCPIQPGSRQDTGPQSDLQLGLCAQFSQQYALYRVLNPGVPPATLNAWLRRGGAEGQHQRFLRTWAWVLKHIKRTDPDEYAQIVHYGVAKPIALKYDRKLNSWSSNSTRHRQHA